MTDDLKRRIEAAREDYKKDYEQEPVDTASSDGANIGYEFLASVISGGVVGYLIDYFAGSLPWGMIVFIVLGFVAGVIRANKRMKDLNG